MLYYSVPSCTILYDDLLSYTILYYKVEFYTDETAEHLRNNTVDGWFQKYMIGVGGLCSVYDPPVGYWCSEHPSGGGAFAFRTPTGAAVPRKALPNSPYKDVSEMIMNVWRPGRWANWMFEVAHNMIIYVCTLCVYIYIYIYTIICIYVYVSLSLSICIYIYIYIYMYTYICTHTYMYMYTSMPPGRFG